MEFVAWPKIPRLKRTVTITEKIDGTTACLVIEADGDGGWFLGCQSRNRIITPESDNAGFARWVAENRDALVDILGPGRHFGEWWGRGIQRGYGLDHKRFSLFDTRRVDVPEKAASAGVAVDIVPLIAIHTMSDEVIDGALARLRAEGSVAAPGYMNPEGIVVRHSQGGQMYKVLLENDHISKTEAGAA